MYANESKCKNNCIINCLTDSHCLAKLCAESIALNDTNFFFLVLKFTITFKIADAEKKYSDMKPKGMNFGSTMITRNVAFFNQRIKNMERS